ncbi:hypothetical protein [Moorena sp. SIO4G3]|uniref:hypothetical protein n=1 Tax=Moorena sp. SIO4G3 TaxID=2607821 RepID=UPI00142A03CE|nr:hypothetical protein [Moorena sp. SIO4G3]NEO79662.1 hypothetical protein [Moorena sp. SIO4G3]
MLKSRIVYHYSSSQLSDSPSPHFSTLLTPPIPSSLLPTPYSLLPTPCSLFPLLYYGNFFPSIIVA